MAFKDGAGNQSFSGFNWSAAAATAQFAVVLVAPPTDNHTPSLGVPLQMLVSNNLGGTSDLQVQVATDVAFAAIIWPGALASVVNGPVTIQPTGLVVNTWYYWRARIAPAGTTTWGPWSSVWRFQVDLNVGKAWNYVYENVGVQTGQEYHGGIESIYENVGVQYTPYAGVEEYVYANLGVQVTLRHDGVDYVYEGDVNNLIPVPHIWFVYKRYGFADDHVLIYGQGFGALQTQYNGIPYLDYGPNFLLPDSPLGVVNWNVQPAMADSYGPDRRIYVGADNAPPFSNVETDIIEVIMPVLAVPSEAAGPQNDLTYLRTTGGDSNKVIWVMYPTIPVAMNAISAAIHSSTRIRVISDPVVPDGLIHQLYMLITPEQYIVAGGRAERKPAHGVYTKTKASLLGTPASWAAIGLETASSVSLGATRRWIPDSAHILPRADLGTGVSVWTPSVGLDTTFWKMNALSAGYVDPAYILGSRSGDITRAAFRLDGSSWLELNTPLAIGPIFSVALTMVLHPNTAAATNILSSFSDVTPDPGTYPFVMKWAGDVISMTVGGQLATNRVDQVNSRAVVVVVSSNGTNGQLLVMDSTPAIYTFVHPPMQASNLKLYLGRPGTAISTGDTFLTADVLDIALWDNVALSTADMWNVANKLDSIYGVTK